MSSDVSVQDIGGRRALIDATVAAIEEHGLAGISMRAITRRAAVSHAAPAYHFRDKAGLFTAVALEGFAMLQKAMTDALNQARRRNPSQRMEALALAYVTFAIEHRAHFEVMFRPELVHPDDPELRQAGLATFGILREAIRAAHDEGFARRLDVDDLTLSAWALVHGIVQLTVHGVLGQVGFPVTPVGLAARLTGLFNDAFAETDER